MTYLYPAAMVLADADHDGWFDHMGDLAGWWVIFPLVMMVFMVLMMSSMLRFWGRGSRRGIGMGPMRMGAIGDMGDHGDQNQTADDGALEVLRRRYAAGELTDEEFDAKRRRLEDRYPLDEL